MSSGKLYQNYQKTFTFLEVPFMQPMELAFFSIMSISLSSCISKVFCIKNQWARFALDFIFCVLPTSLELMLIYHNEAGRIQLTVVVLYLIVFLIAFLKKRITFDASRIVKKFNEQKNLLLEYPRVFLNLNTCICIMAVDFPPHLPSVTKTHAMGCSFMDAGIALTACGSASSFHRRMNRQFRDKPFTRKSLLSIAKGYLIKDGMLFLMGVFRTTFLLASGYSYDVNEYGVHWNFFFTLCQLDISVLLIMWITNDYEWKPLWLSIFILIAYSTSLKFFCLEDLFVSPRFNTFLGENFEGLFSSFGFPLFHFAASYLTFLVEKEHRSVTSIFRYFVYISTCAILLALMPKILAFCLDKFTSLLEIIILPPASTSMNLYSTEKDGVLSVIDRLLRSMQSSFEMHPARRMCNFPFVMRCLSYRLFTKVYSWIFVFCESLITDSPSSQAEILPLQDNSRSKTSLSSSLSSSTTTSLTSTSSSSSSSSSSSLSKPANQSTFFSYLFSRQQFITFLSANIMIGLNHVLFEPSHFQNRRATAVLLCFIILVVCGISYVFSTILSLIGRRNKKKRQN